VKDEDEIASCLQLAMLLEASASPKPGNVDRTSNFLETKFEHFLASAVALGSTYRLAARNGISISKGAMDLSEAQLGKTIRIGTENMIRWQKGGNTNLGTILLLTPIAISAGLTITKNQLNTKRLRANLKKVLRSTNYRDSLEVYKAISTVSPGGIGSNNRLDVMSPESIDRIRKDRIGLLQIFETATKRDSVASEWITGYKITFEIGHPYFVGCLGSDLDINASTVNTFLKILSLIPDALIARKVGIMKARYVSARARKCLEAGGLTTHEGRCLVNTLDRDLRTPNHELNPGTTADLVSAVLATALLEGLRP
jgi:triphosphoribosyl-dephospho-CoA synthase